MNTIRILTADIARDGDVIAPLGMDVAAYMRNPVVLWAHDDAIGTHRGSPANGLPIARTVALRPSADAIDADFEFLAGDPFVARVENAWKQGFLRSASVGWLTRAWEPLPPPARGRRHTKTELLEWSLVPIPADQGATRSGYAETLRALGLTPLETPATVAALEELQRNRMRQAAAELHAATQLHRQLQRGPGSPLPQHRAFTKEPRCLICGGTKPQHAARINEAAGEAVYHEWKEEQ